MWQVQDGFGQKTFDYEYNSQNAATQMTYQAGSTNTDYRRFYYTYDLAGRMKKVITDGSGPVPDYQFPVVEYGYNENSQIDSLLYHSGAYLSLSYFNQRNWVTAQESRENKMGYQLDYYLNGNVKSRKVTGNYRLNYPTEVREMNSVYTYDKANRLTNVDRFNVKSYSPVEAFSYDKDGNILTLTRDYKGDNFIYQYYSGTNRLKNINGTAMQQYIYDYNGNVTADSVRKVTGITYDYRNLPVEMNLTPNNEDRYKYKMRYKYDEAGNRIRKQMYRSRLGEENWTLYNDEVYIRDAKGNETAIYENSVLAYFNIRGSGLEGKVRKDDRGNTIFSYYYKDHLGSITAVMDGASGTITQAQDYDSWGDICRTYSTTDTTSNRFTGKERDTETGYDYFGARYYDSRIGRWLQTEPLYNKYLQFSPYQYGLLNPMILKDIDGKWIPEYNSKDNSITVKAEEGDTDEDLALQLGISMEQFNKDFESGKSSYDITKFVTPNKEYDGNAKISNCHGFVYYALYGGIENDLEPQDKNYKIFMNNLEKKLDSESPQTGEIAIFYLSKDYYVDEFKISKNDAQHTAIFIIKDRNEKKYFLNRSNTEEPVVISTTEDIIDKYKKVKPSKAPDLRENPDYFHKK